MTKLLHVFIIISFKTEAFRYLIMSQQGKKTTKNLLDVYT